MMILLAETLMQEGGKVNLAHTVARFAVLVVICLLFLAAQRFLARHRLWRSVSPPLNALVLVLLVMLLLGPVLDQMHSYVRAGLKAAAVFLGVAIGLRLFDILYFDRLAQWRHKPQVPLVVRDLGRWAAALIALVLIMRGFFPGLNLNVFAVSSLIVGYILGNASQDTLGNLFAGLALNTERPFQIGDWVIVSGHTGVVVDTTWRATRLRTKADDYIVIPNSSIGKESIINFSRPTGNHACYLSIGASYDTPPNQAREAILSVLSQAPGVNPEPPPCVYLTSYGDFAINYTIKFFIGDYSRIDPIQSSVMDRLWYAFRREGISIPFPIRDLRQRDMVADERAQLLAAQGAIRQLLSGVDLFQSFSPEEMNRLVDGAKLKRYACGEHLCRQGEAGDSFYVIRSGRVAVSMDGAANQPVTVAHLSSGAFFGEMSLLTGEPRSGTVSAETDVEVLCVSKSDFAGLLQANVNLAGKLAKVLERRMAERQTIMTASTASRITPQTHFALAARIRRFFGL